MPDDWRKSKDEDPDDEQIKTPKDVVMMLGFDPAGYDPRMDEIATAFDRMIERFDKLTE
jgi:hypothetical protein